MHKGDCLIGEYKKILGIDQLDKSVLFSSVIGTRLGTYLSVYQNGINRDKFIGFAHLNQQGLHKIISD